MDKTEYRAVIKFLVLEGQSSKQVEEQEFQRGRESLEDDHKKQKRVSCLSFTFLPAWVDYEHHRYAFYLQRTKKCVSK